MIEPDPEDSSKPQGQTNQAETIITLYPRSFVLRHPNLDQAMYARHLVAHELGHTYHLYYQEYDEETRACLQGTILLQKAGYRGEQAMGDAECHKFSESILVKGGPLTLYDEGPACTSTEENTGAKQIADRREPEAPPTVAREQAWHNEVRELDKKAGETPSPELRLVQLAFARLTRAQDLPKAQITVGQWPQTYVNAMAQREGEGAGRIWFDKTLVRFLSSDPEGIAFVLAHEHGHLLASNCQASNKRLWSHLVGGEVAGALAGGWTGAADAMRDAQHRICEENADIDAVRFMREAGIDPTAGVRFFTRITGLEKQYNRPGAYFMSTHPVGPERIARLAAAIANKKIPDLVP
jgi:Zn-dependent protease with chaperone function